MGGASHVCAWSKSGGEESISQKNSINSFITNAAPNSCVGPKETGKYNLQSTQEETSQKKKNSIIDQTAERRDKTAGSPKATQSVTRNNLVRRNPHSCLFRNSIWGDGASSVTRETRAEQSSGTHSSVAARPRLNRHGRVRLTRVHGASGVVKKVSHK